MALIRYWKMNLGKESLGHISIKLYHPDLYLSYWSKAPWSFKTKGQKPHPTYDDDLKAEGRGADVTFLIPLELLDEKKVREWCKDFTRASQKYYRPFPRNCAQIVCEMLRQGRYLVVLDERAEEAKRTVTQNLAFRLKPLFCFKSVGQVCEAAIENYFDQIVEHIEMLKEGALDIFEVLELNLAYIIQVLPLEGDSKRMSLENLGFRNYLPLAELRWEANGLDFNIQTRKGDGVAKLAFRFMVTETKTRAEAGDSLETATSPEKNFVFYDEAQLSWRDIGMGGLLQYLLPTIDHYHDSLAEKRVSQEHEELHGCVLNRIFSPFMYLAVIYYSLQGDELDSRIAESLGYVLAVLIVSFPALIICD